MRKHWLALFLPPSAFLLAAGVTHQAIRAVKGVKYERWDQHYQASFQEGMKGDREKALKEMIAAAEMAPDDAQVQSRLATGFHELGQAARGLEHLERAVRLRPPSDQTRDSFLGLIGAYCDLGDFERAERILQQDVLPRWPETADGHYYQGLITLHRDKGEEATRRALSSFEQCLRIKSDHAKARLESGGCLVRLGRLTEAREAFEAVVKAFPSFAGAYNELAAVLRQLGRIDEANRTLEKFQALDKKQQRVRYLQTQVSLQQFGLKDLLEMGELFLDLGQLQEAEGALARYTKQEPADPRGYRKLAEAYRRQKKERDAVLTEKLAAALETHTAASQ